MRSKRRALGLVATSAMFAAAILGSLVVRPASSHDASSGSAASIASATSTSAYASLRTYHDL
jgi:hypothetical protein